MMPFARKTPEYLEFRDLISNLLDAPEDWRIEVCSDSCRMSHSTGVTIYSKESTSIGGGIYKQMDIFVGRSPICYWFAENGATGNGAPYLKAGRMIDEFFQKMAKDEDDREIEERDSILRNWLNKHSRPTSKPE